MKQHFVASKLWKPAGAITGAVAVVGAAGYGLIGAPSGRANPAATTATPPVASPAVSGDAVPYTPSKYPGVLVRNVPAPPSGGGKNWIYVRPGTAKPRLGTRLGTRGTIWYEAGKTPAGGIAAHVSRDFYPYEVARIGADGKVKLDCVEPGSKSQAAKRAPSAKVSQAQHAAKPKP